MATLLNLIGAYRVFLEIFLKILSDVVSSGLLVAKRFFNSTHTPPPIYALPFISLSKKPFKGVKAQGL